MINIETFLNPNIKKKLRAISLLSHSSQKSKKDNEDIYSCLEDSSPYKASRRYYPGLSQKNSPIKQSKSAKFLSGPEAILQHKSRLSDYEKKEILAYSEVFYVGNNIKKHNGKFYDENGYYKVFIQDHIAYRYQILDLIGEGSFGIVLNCLDYKFQTPVAIKILRQGKDFDEIGQIEVKNLQKISKPECIDTIIQKYEEFKFRDHYCIVFELLSIDLYKFLKQNSFRGIDKNLIRRISVQIIIGLKHIHNAGYIHCDLKPENIIFKARNKSSIKIIDFGSACEAGNLMFSYIQSRYYRAPEVVLGLEYTNKIDIWSLGCILCELHTGYPIFTGENEVDQLCKIVEVLGDFSSTVINKSRRKNEIFNDSGKLIDLENRGIQPGSRSLLDIIKTPDSYFIDFLKECLKLDPDQRIDAETALLHPWIKGTKKPQNKILKFYTKDSISDLKH
jgi:dual specificity tyrosine-phosphorylation-regulated kinase 2/3/4